MSEHEFEVWVNIKIKVPFTYWAAGSRMNERQNGQTYIELGDIDFGCKTLVELQDLVLEKEQDDLLKQAWEAYYEKM